MSKVLILGINGFSGRHFQKYVASRGFMNDFHFSGSDIIENTACTFPFLKANLANKDELEQILTHVNPDYIINLTGSFHNDNFDELFKLNAGITYNLLDLVVKNKLPVKRVLLIGSAAEYGTNAELPLNETSALMPVGNYGLTKVIQTHTAMYFNRNFGLPVSIARTFNIFASDLPVSLSIGSFINQINRMADGGVLFTGNLKSKRDYLPVDNVVDAYWKILMNGLPGEIYNVCSGQSVLMSDLLTLLVKQSGKNIKTEIDPKLYKPIDIPDSYGDNSKLRKLGWQPNNIL